MIQLIVMSAIAIGAPAVDPLSQLQGSWTPQFTEFEGVNLLDVNYPTYPRLAYRITNDQVDITFDKKKFVECTIKIVDNGDSPRGFDLMNNGKVFCSGIFLRDGDYLVICYSAAPTKRPEAFNSKGRSKTILEILRRN